MPRAWANPWAVGGKVKKKTATVAQSKQKRPASALGAEHTFMSKRWASYPPSNSGLELRPIDWAIESSTIILLIFWNDNPLLAIRSNTQSDSWR